MVRCCMKTSRLHAMAKTRCVADGGLLPLRGELSCCRSSCCTEFGVAARRRGSTATLIASRRDASVGCSERGGATIRAPRGGGASISGARDSDVWPDEFFAA